MSVIDMTALVVITLGIIITSALFALAAADWFRSHRQDDRREALRAAVILIVWLGFLATLTGRLVPEFAGDLAWVALSARLALLVMVLWLLIERDRHVKGEARADGSRFDELEAEVVALRVEVAALRHIIETRDERIATLTAELVIARLPGKEKS